MKPFDLPAGSVGCRGFPVPGVMHFGGEARYYDATGKAGPLLSVEKLFRGWHPVTDVLPYEPPEFPNPIAERWRGIEQVDLVRLLTCGLP